MAEDITVGSVGVEVVPDARGFGRKAASQIDPEARALGKEVGKTLGREMAAPIAPAIRDSVRDGLSGSRSQGSKGGAEFGGAFADTAKARIAAAFRDLPKAKVGADATELDAELVAIRARLEALHDIRIGVDLDAGEALAEIEAVRARLVDLGARSPHIDVKVDAAKAVAELSLISAEVKALSSTDAEVKVGAQGGSGLSGLLTDLVSIGPAGAAAAIGMALLATALIPVAAGLLAVAGAAGILVGILGGAFVAAAAGLYPIISALVALSAADKQSATSAAQSAQARVNAAFAVQSAQASLANTIANADSAALRSAEAVVTARQRLADAQRQAARSVAQAVQQEQAAERSLTRTLREQGDAQVALTQARRDAQRAIEDINRAVTDGALDQRQAELDVQTARQRLQEVNNDPLASTLDRQQAQLDYQQAIQRLDDLGAANKRLAQDAATANQKGVNGADAVVAAQQRYTDAIQATADAVRGLKNATQGADDARIAAAQSVRNAEQAVADAIRAQADQARQSAFAISQAQAAVASAQRSQVQAATQVQAASKKADDALGKLSPTGRAFVTFLHDEFLPAVKTVIAAATDGLAPGLMQGLVILEGVLPDIATDMGKFAGAAGGFFSKIAQGLASPGAKRFFDFLADLSGPALSGLADFITNIGSGLAGIFEALGPVAADIGDALVHISEKFADFGNSVGSGGKLDQFVQWLKDNGPAVAHDLADIATAVADVVVALAPLGVTMLDIIDKFSRLLSVVAPILPVLTPITPLWTALTGVFHAGAVAIDAVKRAGSDFVGFVRREWSQLTSRLAGPIQHAVEEIGRAWGDIKHGALDARDYVEGRFDVLVGFVEGLPGRIGRASVGMFDGIKDAFRSAINFVIEAWNKLSFGIDIPDKVFGIPVPGGGGHFGIDTPDIQPLATGGLVTGPTFALIGEGAESEMVTPLSQLGDFASWARELGWAQSMTQMPDGSGAGGPHTVIEQLNITNPVPEPAPVSARKMHDRLEWVLS